MEVEGKFKCILADPPWGFRTYSGKRSTPHRGAHDHYQTMTYDAMKELPIGDLADKDCALFMWVVGSHIPEAIDLGRAWGFEFKTDAFYWMKQKLIGADQINIFTNDIPPPAISMGYWSRKQVEPVFLFTKGKPRRLSKGVRQVIIASKREHSRKPDEQYAQIEALVEGPYLELFARRRRDGWSSWGNEMEKFAA